MRIPRKSATVLALVVGGSLALSACSGGGRGTSSSSSSSSSGSNGAPANATITVAHEQEFASYNNNTADQNAVQNTVVLNQVLRGFWDFAKDGSVKPDKEFGTYTKTKDDPLTVDYSINPKAVWSDGKPIDCADFLLAWAANSGKYASTETDENGNPTTGFSSASTSGYDQMNKPSCKAGDKKVTVTYATPFADWQGQFGAAGGMLLPAHVLEQKSGVTDLITAIQNDDKAALDKAAQFYNTGWIAKPGTIDKTTMLSSGPYQLDSWQAGQSLTLTANPKWWGTPAKTKTIIVRFIDATQQAQALQNGEIQVARPQPAQDILAQLKAIGPSAKVDQGDEYTFEHMDFNFGGAFKDADLRKAFALCAPRQQIVDNLIKPVNSKAVLDNGHYYEPFQDEYKTGLGGAYSGQYDKVDVAQAKALVDGKHAAGTVVRIGYKTPNQRRTDTVSLIRDSCNQAGFNVQDAGQPDFFGNGLHAGNFDVALFAWSGSPLISGNAAAYTTGGGNNNGHYSNPQVDALTKQLVGTTNVDAQAPLVAKIEKNLWSDLATIPIFAFPGLQANSTNVTGPAFQPAQSQQTWNMQDWAVGKQ